MLGLGLQIMELTYNLPSLNGRYTRTVATNFEVKLPRLATPPSFILAFRNGLE